MSRPLSLLMASALVAGTVVMSAAPASAIEFGVTARSGEWHNEQWRDWNDDWRWRGHRSHFEPGFWSTSACRSDSARLLPAIPRARLLSRVGRQPLLPRLLSATHRPETQRAINSATPPSPLGRVGEGGLRLWPKVVRGSQRARAAQRGSYRTFAFFSVSRRRRRSSPLAMIRTVPPISSDSRRASSLSISINPPNSNVAPVSGCFHFLSEATVTTRQPERQSSAAIYFVSSWVLEPRSAPRQTAASPRSLARWSHAGPTK